MRKLVSVLLALMLLLPMLPAGASAADNLSVTQIKGEMAYNNATPMQPVLSVVNLSDHEVQLTVEVYDELIRRTIQSIQYSMPVSKEPLLIQGFVYKPLQTEGQINTYRYRVKSSGGFKEDFYSAQIMRIDKTTKQPYYIQVHNPRFPRNTVSSFGPQFRVLTPGLTKEWYMFTPINLGIQGRQTFTLVGGNMYEVGEAYVDVAGDSVTVSYRYYFDGQTDKIRPVTDFLYFFNDYSAVTTVDHNKLPKAFQFGKPFSIQQQLGGDTNVLMFVRNTESFYRFPMPDQQLSRNYPMSDIRSAERLSMLQMMDPVEGLNLINDHNYAN